MIFSEDSSDWLPRSLISTVSLVRLRSVLIGLIRYHGWGWGEEITDAEHGLTMNRYSQFSSAGKMCKLKSELYGIPS